MRAGFSIQIAVACCAAMILAPPALVSADAELQWYVQLYPQNPDFIEVTIAAKDMPTNASIKEVSFEVTFYDAHDRYIRQQAFEFTYSDLPSLGPKVYRRYFQHSVNSPQSVKGDFLYYTLEVGGGKVDNLSPPERIPGKVGSGKRIRETRDIITIPPVPKTDDLSPPDLIPGKVKRGKTIQETSDIITTPRQVLKVIDTAGFTEKTPYSGDCKKRPAGSVCIRFSDDYVWLAHDAVITWEKRGSWQGKKIAVALGRSSDYYHVLGTHFVREAPAGFTEKTPYSGDCKKRPAGSVCIRFSDGYVWLVYDSAAGWDERGTWQGKKIAVAAGKSADYYHVLGTDFVKKVPK